MLWTLLGLPMKGLLYLAEELYERAYQEFMDENAVRRRLLEAQMLREFGEVSDEEYEAFVAASHERLRAIRAQLEIDAGEAGRGGALEIEGLEVEVHLLGER